MIRILIDVEHDTAHLAALEAVKGVELRIADVSDAPRELPASMIGEIDVLFCTHPPTNAGAMSSLRWVQIASSGYAQLLPHDLPARHIRATNARGCFDVPIAEWNIAMMINLHRDITQMLRNQTAHVWDRATRFANELRGRTVGLWGYGGLARETARLAKSMGLRVHVLARNGVRPAQYVYRMAGTGDPEGVLPDRIFTAGNELAFLRTLDFLILAMPLTPQTEGIVCDEHLQALPRHAYVLNPARGALIRQESLLRALDEGWIAGAALDTHYQYPLPPEHQLWSYPNVILTPHISGTSISPPFRARIWELFLENVRRFKCNDQLLNELTEDNLRGL